MTKYECNHYISSIAEEFERIMDGDLKNNNLIDDDAYLIKVITHFLKNATQKHNYNYILLSVIDICEHYELTNLKVKLINLKKS